MDATTLGVQAAGQMENAAASSGWDSAATPPPSTPPAASQPSDTPQTTQPATTTPAASTAPGSTTPAATPAPVQPVVVTSQKAPGIFGVVDSIADALVGKTTPEIGKDAEGNEYIKQHTMSRGQQWVRIGAGVLGGAAKGFAAGKGRNPGAAAAAGFDEGQQLSKQAAAQTPALQKQMLADANYQKLRMDAAEQAWHLTAMQHEATQHDVEFAQGQEDRLMKVDGATLLGTAADPNDITKILHADPQVMKSMIQNHQIEILPHYNPDGTRAGIRVFKMPDGYRKTIEPAGTIFHTFDSTTGQYIEHKASEPLTAGEVDDYETAASNAAQKFKLDQANLAQKAAATKEAEANATKATEDAKEVPSVIAKNKSETTKNYAEAGAASANAAKTRQDLSIADGTNPNLTHQTIVHGMIDGSVDITKAVGIFRDPHAREAYIAEAKQLDPTWTMQKYQNMLKMRQDMSSGKLGDQIQSFNAFLGHADGVSNTVNTLRNTNSPYINHTINWLRQNASGSPVVAAMLPEIDATRNEFQNFIANHALQKSEIEKGEKLLSEDQTPAQMQASIKSFMQVALTRLGSIQYRAAQTFGDASPQLMSPQNVQAVRDMGLASYANNYGLMPHNQQQPNTSQPPAIPAGTAPPAAGMSRIWAPGSPTWKDVPTAQVPKNVPGLVVRQ